MLLLAALLPFLGTLLYFAVLPPGPVAAAAYASAKLLMVPCRLALRPVPPAPVWGAARWWALGLLLGLAQAAVVLLAGLGPLRGVLDAATPAIRAKVEGFGCAGAGYWALAAAVSLAHSGFEEWYWRAGVWARIGSHPLAALAFSLHHVVVCWVYAGPVAGVGLGLATGAAGWCWSRLYAAGGRLGPAWLAHALADLAVFALGAVALGRW